MSSLQYFVSTRLPFVLYAITATLLSPLTRSRLAACAAIVVTEAQLGHDRRMLPSSSTSLAQDLHAKSLSA